MCSPAVVDGLPQTTPEKQDKLVGILRKLYDSIGTIREGVSACVLPPTSSTCRQITWTSAKAVCLQVA